jgi:iron complex outermembrane receptor protein
MPPAFGQSATPGSSIRLDEVVIQSDTARPEARRPTQRRTVSGEARPPSPAVRRSEPDQATAPSPAERSGVATSNPEEVARLRLDALAGGTALISQSELADRGVPTIVNTLTMVPGVIVQSMFGGNDQPRIQMRGSGLQQNPVERGILILKDGLPLNRADGSYIVGFADPSQAQFIEVFRGYTANRLGATVLGGAINFVSPNGATMPGIAAGVEVGSFGEVTATARAGGRSENADVLGQVSSTRRDGFRDFNNSDRLNVNLNTGFKLTEAVSTRLFLGYTDLGFDIPGPLTWEKLQQDPKQIYPGPTVTLPGPVIRNPGPNVVRDRPSRDADQIRAGSRTSASFGPHLVDVALGLSQTDDAFLFPIASSLRSTDGGDFAGVVRYAYGADGGRPLPLFEATAKYVIGSADRLNYQNIAGTQGALFGKSKLDATTLSLYAGMQIPLGERFTLAPALSYAHATRENDDSYGMGLRPVAGFNPVTGAFQTALALAQDTSYTRAYAGWSPSLGLRYELAPNNSLFAAVSRGFEPPTHDDLLAPINGTPFFSPGAPIGGVRQLAFATPNLKAQTATTVEGGWRGTNGPFSWNIVTYYSWIENELLSLRDASGAQLASVNADKTSHFGVDVGYCLVF